MKQWMAYFLAALSIGGVMNSAIAKEDTLESAIFAGGCFWCIEAELEQTNGVASVTSGYTGGHVPNPTYEMVSKGDTGHYEAVEVRYDPKLISYEALLAAFWSNIDPLDDGGQFYDRGQHYQTAIFFNSTEQENLAQASKMKVQAMLEKPVATDILPAKIFYPAEDYHQDYYKTNTLRYNAYKHGSGRESTLERVWGDLREALKPAPENADEPRN